MTRLKRVKKNDDLCALRKFIRQKDNALSEIAAFKLKNERDENYCRLLSESTR